MDPQPPIDVTKAKVSAEWAHDRPLITCRFQPSGASVFTGAEHGDIQRFAVDGGAKTNYSGGHEGWTMAVCPLPAGNIVVSSATDGKLVWWDAGTDSPTPIRSIPAHHGWIRAVVASPDGQWIASAGNDLVVRMWNANDGTLIRELAGHQKHIYSLLVHPSGEKLYSGDLGGWIKSWEIPAGTEAKSFEAKDLYSYNGGQRVDFGGVRSIALSPDGLTLAAGGLTNASNPLGNVHDPLVQLFHAESGELVGKFTAPEITNGCLWRIQYLVDGTLYGGNGGNSGGYLFFWKPGTEKDIFRFKLPNTCRDADLHPNGTTIATAHHDGKVRLTSLLG